jgi:acyl dehydratase
VLDKYAEQIALHERYVSRGRTITETDVVLFAAFGGDWYPLHTDREWAARSVFGERIAHGLLLLVVGTGFLPVRPGVVVAFYGIDELRFVGPVRLGDTIHSEFEVVAREEKKERREVLTLALDVQNQRGEAVLTAKLKMLCNRSPSQG